MKKKKNAKPDSLPLYKQKNKGSHKVDQAEFDRIEAEKIETEKRISQATTATDPEKISWRVSRQRKKGA